MLNTNDLQALQAQQSQLSLDRKSRSMALGNKGFKMLQLAHASNFEDKSLLGSASEAFIQSIGYDRHNADGYLGMAQILFLVQDYALMNKYLDELQLLQPGHLAIKDLRDLVKANAPTDHLRADPLSVSEPGLSFEDMSMQLVRYVFEISKAPILPHQLVVDRQEQVALAQLLQQRQSHLQRLEQQVEQLETSLDTLSLRQRLNPIHHYVKQLENQLKVSDKARNLLLNCQQGVKQVAMIKTRLPEIQAPQDIPTLEKALEFLVDSCDHVADQLDELEQRGYHILPVELHYRHWVQEIEHAFEEIDARQDELSVSVL